MRSILKIAIALFFLGALTSCPGGKDDPDDDILNPGGDPDSVSLVFPENNSECTEGQSLNTLESTIIFKWQQGTNVDSYEVNVRNLDTNTSNTINANTNEAAITLLKNTPYEWFVVSKKSGSDVTPSSAKWQFYNAGTGVENYAPFPADAVNPTRGQTIAAATSVTLEWSGNDVDNDIENFEVLFSTSSDPTTSIATTSQSTTTATISSGQTYYWRVITKDAVGNTSASDIFNFIVQ